MYIYVREMAPTGTVHVLNCAADEPNDLAQAHENSNNTIHSA